MTTAVTAAAPAPFNTAAASLHVVPVVKISSKRVVCTDRSNHNDSKRLGRQFSSFGRLSSKLSSTGPLTPSQSNLKLNKGSLP